MTTSGRDRMDAILDGWRRELPDLHRPKFDFAKRVARLDQLQEEALSRCLAQWNLVIADLNVLSVLRTAGVPYELRPTDLRNHLVRTSAGIANILRRLEQMKLVERIPDPADKRSSWVRLTSHGIEVAEEAIRAWNTVQEKMFADVDPQLAQQASDMLRAVLLAVGDDEPAAPVARRGRDASGDASARRVLAGANPVPGTATMLGAAGTLLQVQDPPTVVTRTSTGLTALALAGHSDTTQAPAVRAALITAGNTDACVARKLLVTRPNWSLTSAQRSRLQVLVQTGGLDAGTIPGHLHNQLTSAAHRAEATLSVIPRSG